MDKVFLTGDAGRLGGMISKGIEKDFLVVGYDKGNSIKQDILDLEFLKSSMVGCKYVVHVAAIPHPHRNPSPEEMQEFFTVNVQGTLNILSAAVFNNVKRVIFISSTGYYGCSLNGKLKPLYFPIDEQHPCASSPERSEGALDAYCQSKVMAEELCAYFGSNRLVEVIALRSAPANTKEEQYHEKDFDWRKIDFWPDYRRTGFFANNHPNNLVQAVKLSLQSDKVFKYEPFNVMDRYTFKGVDVKEFLATDYPDVPVHISLENNPCLFSTKKIQDVLGFKAIDHESK